MKTFARASILSGILACSVPASAGFQSTVEFLAAVGRVSGQGGAQFYSTVWATNLTAVPISFKLDFLTQGQANTSPAGFSDTLAAGQTKVYENVVETKLGLTNAIGAARITSTGKILVSERIYNQPPGADLGNTEGLFFAGVPGSFSISSGQSASIQGINQGGAENFRYNFAMIETGGGSPTANVQVFDGNGTLLGQKAYTLLPYEQIQPNVADVVPGIATINARITATVTGGSGSLILAGAQLANLSQDSSGFEMSFPDNLIETGSGGLSLVSHDASLTGAGTAASPLGIAAGQVVRSLNGLHDAVTLAAGSNVTLTPSGQTITIAATGGGGGGGGLSSVSHDATLTGNGTGATPLGIALPLSLHVDSGSIASLTNSGSGTGLNVQVANGSFALQVTNGSSTGKGLVVGSGGTAIEIDSTSVGIRLFAGDAGVHATGSPGIFGEGQSGGLSALFSNGNVRIDDDLHVIGRIFAGTKDFRIDHPLDPENKYLVHASIESNEMLNVYSGNATLGPGGSAVVLLPEWMEAENGDFRYQLTALGTPQPGLFVSRRIENHRFTIAGGVSGAEVSWQVTGVRRDRFAKAHPLVVEEVKPEGERGLYLHPDAFGQSKEKGLSGKDPNRKDEIN